MTIKFKTDEYNCKTFRTDYTKLGLPALFELIDSAWEKYNLMNKRTLEAQNLKTEIINMMLVAERMAGRSLYNKVN